MKDRTPAIVCIDQYTYKADKLPRTIDWKDISPAGECLGIRYASGGKELAQWLKKVRVLTDTQRDWVIYTDDAFVGQNDVQDWCERRYKSTHRKPMVYLRLELPTEADEWGGTLGAWYKAEWSPKNPEPKLVRFATYAASGFEIGF